MFGPLPAFETLYHAPNDGEAQDTVKYPPCSCELPWYQCRCFSEQVTYTGPGIDGTGVPCPNFLRAVVRENPGADLILSDGPPHLAKLVKDTIASARAEGV